MRVLVLRYYFYSGVDWLHYYSENEFAFSLMMRYLPFCVKMIYDFYLIPHYHALESDLGY